MRIHIATDHAAYETKEALVSHLQDAGHEVIDHGAFSYDPDDDYPAFCLEAAQAVVDEPGSLGVVLGGSGNGEQMAANLVDGARCALAWNLETARLTRAHNDANMVSVGGRMHSLEEALAIVDAFIAEPFSGEARHQRRIDQLAAYEAARPGRA
ncbi:MULTISPECIES: ribose-5-phosphate isomerase [Actinomyces]|uniref:Ribose-5-phosphate isomerase B n=1 Tax=Actinomyces marmotae TaxID=2737173 RepID=A0A6M8BA39_9ACTO|nr:MULTISPECIES: ribose-5-phosphate isomerase [Actinomyces]QKD80103.1 ribose-5-phosphate isomerase [Actinomyces marmotae]